MQNHDTLIAVIIMAVSTPLYLLSCQREHVRRQARKRQGRA